MNVFKQKASVRQNANQGPPERWRGHFAKRWGIDSFSAFLTTALLSCLLFTGLAQAADNVVCKNEWFEPGTSGASAGQLVRDYRNYGISRSVVNYCDLDTRYKFIAILIRALEHDDLGKKGNLEYDEVLPFTDLDDPEWLKDTREIHKAYKLGIISDQSDGQFEPNRDIIRIEAIAFTVRTYEHYCGTIDDAGASHFSDRQDAHPSMREYMDKGLAKDLISGHSHFRPNETVPRYESVAFVDKLINALKNKSCSTSTGSITVTIEPAKARDAGAKWKADAGVFVGWVGPIESGKTVNGFALGSTPISFTDVDGCTTPPDTSVTVIANETVDKTVEYDCVVPPNSVTISFSSTGTGDGGFEIDYGSSDQSCENCDIEVPNGNNVTVKAIANSDSTFAGWDSSSSCFSSRDNPASFTASDCSVKAIFNKSGCGNLGCELKIEVSGDGTVTSDISGINCDKNGGNGCSYVYPETTIVELTATPADGSDVGSWSGDCAGETSNVCEVKMDSDKIVKIDFVIDPDEVEIIEKVKEQQKEIDTLSDQLAEADKKIGVLEGELEAAETKIDDLQDKLKTATEDIAGLELKLGQAKDELKKVNDKLELAEADSKKKAEKIKKLEGDLATVKAEAAEIEAELKGDIAQLETDLETVKKTQDEQADKLAKVEKDLKDAEENFEKAKARIEELEQNDSIRKALFNKIPTPSDDSENEEVDVNLSWTSAVPDEVTLTYKVYFGADQDNLSTSICEGESLQSCDINGDLEYGTEYYWQLEVFSGDISPIRGPKWRFKTLANKPPPVPEIDIPQHQATDIDPNQDLTLSCKESDDPEGEAVTYSFYFGVDTTQLQPINCADPNLPSCTIPAIELDTGKAYFWQCAAKDASNPPQRGDPWQFQTQANQPPNKASNPVLMQGGVELGPDSEVDPKADLTFGWTDNGDPDPEDVNLSYEVCYMDTAEIDLKNENVDLEKRAPCVPSNNPQTLPASLEKLEFGTSYAWIVSVKDEHGNKSEWDVWKFKTKAAPVKLTLEAKSGYANTLLKWGFADTIDPKVVKYRILRIKGKDTDFSTATTVAEIDAPMSSKYDEEALEKKKNYCYRIDALNDNGNTLYQSNEDCAIFGETILAMQPTGGLKGEIVDVPIPILNAGKLTIGSGEIWLRYDGNVIAVKDVKNTPITAGYTVTHSTQNETDNIKTVIISISFDDLDPPEMMGEGSLVDVSFEIIGDFGQSSPLELVPFVDGKGGTKIQDNNFVDIDLKLTNSQFGVKKATRRLVRDGNTGVESRFYVGEAYVRGDVRGDGTIETVDARMARFIGIGKYAPNPKQLIAGDVNLDNSVNSADAMMIIHRILYGDWPGAPAYEVVKTRKLRRSTPIVLSLEEVSGVSGSEVTAMLRISNLVKLSAMNLSIAFDTNVVEIVKVEKTGLAEETQFLANPDNEAGVIHIGMDSQIPLNGDGDIAKITLRLVSGGSVRSTPLTIARANLYDLFGRDFVISALQRTIEAHHGEAIITDIPEEPIIEDRTVETPIDDLFPKPATTWLHSATCQINDHSGNPIAGATVTMGDKTVITDEYGYCAVVGLTEGEYTMTVNKDGYIFPDMPCQVGDEENCRLNFMNLNVGMATPASCQLYVVHDEGLNDSQFLTISLDGLYTVNLLGPMYYGYDFESIGIDPKTNLIYAVPGDKVVDKSLNQN